MFLALGWKVEDLGSVFGLLDFCAGQGLKSQAEKYVPYTSGSVDYRYPL